MTSEEEQKTVPPAPDTGPSAETATQEKDDPHSSSEMWVRDNTGFIQVFIQNMNTTGQPCHQDIGTLASFGKGDEFHLEDPDECARFVEKYKDGEFLALAVTLAVFNYLPLDDLPEVTTSLLEYLPIFYELDPNGKQVFRQKSDPYLSLNSKVAVIGGQVFSGSDGRPCVGLGERSGQALTNIWRQFPALRQSIISWLVDLQVTHTNRGPLFVSQIVVAFSRVISQGFEEAKDKIFPFLYKSVENVSFLGTLGYMLYQNPALRSDMAALMQRWITSGHPWLWYSGLIAYALMQDEKARQDFEKPLRGCLKSHLQFPNVENLYIIAVAMSPSTHTRTLFCEAFSNVFSKLHRREDKLLMAKAYIQIIQHGCRYWVNRDFPALPLVACDVGTQQKLLAPVIVQVMFNFTLRKKLYAVLEQYLKKISAYDPPFWVLRHTAAFFQSMGGSGFYPDVAAFLKKCHCSAASKIYELLVQARPKRLGE